MSQTCSAVVFSGDGHHELREFPVPDPPEGGAVLAVEAVGMCGSDVLQYHGHRHVPGEVSPVVPGHEIVGRIAAITQEAAQNWRVSEGDRVCIDLNVVCGRCRGCLSGGWCRSLQVYGYTKGPDDDGGLWGGYGEFMRLLPQTHVMRAPGGLSPEQLTVFEPLASVLNWMRKLGVAWGNSVVVQGPGHVGLLCVAVAAAFGASPVIVMGTSQDQLRLDAATRVGATASVVVDEEDAVGAVRQLTGSKMADVVLDAAPAPATVATAIELAGFEGRVGLIGLKHSQAVPAFQSDLVVLKALSLVGCAGSTPASMEAAVSFLADRPEIAQQIAGASVTLDTVERGLALLERRVEGEDATHVTLVHGHKAS